VAGVGIDVVLCNSPDRLARKFAYQALLIEEFTRAGTRVEFVRGPRGDSLEDQLLVQFQGMFAEYEKAQSWSATGAARRTAPRAERSTCWAAPCSAAAIFVRPKAVGAAYEIVEHEIFTRSRNLLLQVEKVFCWSLLSGLNCSQRCWSVG
jgi:site-specific DNA recombinase